MERMWQERSDYGHFFYRIPNGESAADAYDRICSFNESLWRQFAFDDFPDVCVLVTHGLMGRVFLMKWYKWTVEYFEDLRNIHHCEFLIMEKNEEERFDLKTKLRTWSELKAKNPGPPSPELPPTRWGGCPDGCNHGKTKFTDRVQRINTMVDLNLEQTASPVLSREHSAKIEEPRKQLAAAGNQNEALSLSPRHRSTMKFDARNLLHEYEISTTREATEGELVRVETHSSDDDINELLSLPAHRRRKSMARHIGRDGGGSHSGMPSPEELSEADENDDLKHEDKEEHEDKEPDGAQARPATKRADSSRFSLSVLDEHPDQAVISRESVAMDDKYSAEAEPLADKDEVNEEGTPQGDIY
jgi:hypothetical protein